MNTHLRAILLCTLLLRASEYEKVFDALDGLVEEAEEDLDEESQSFQAMAYTNRQMRELLIMLPEVRTTRNSTLLMESTKEDSLSHDTPPKPKQVKEELHLADDEDLYYFDFDKLKLRLGSIFYSPPEAEELEAEEEEFERKLSLAIVDHSELKTEQHSTAPGKSEGLKLVDSDEGLYYFDFEKHAINSGSIFDDIPPPEEDPEEQEEEEDERTMDTSEHVFDFEKYTSILDSIFDVSEEDETTEDKEYLRPLGGNPDATCGLQEAEWYNGWEAYDQEKEYEGAFGVQLNRTNASFETPVGLMEPEDELDVDYYSDYLPSDVIESLLNAVRREQSLKHLKQFLDKAVELAIDLEDLQANLDNDEGALAMHEAQLAGLTKLRIRDYDRWLAVERPELLKPPTGDESNAELLKYDRELKTRVWLERTKEKKLYRPSDRLAEKTTAELSYTVELKARIKLMEAFKEKISDALTQLSDFINKKANSVEVNPYQREISYTIKPFGLSRSLLAPFQVNAQIRRDIEVIYDVEAPEYSKYRTQGFAILCWSEALTENSVYTLGERMVVEAQGPVTQPTAKITVPFPDPQSLHGRLSVAKVHAVNEIIFQQLTIAALFRHRTILVDLAPFLTLGFLPGEIFKYYQNWIRKFNILDLEGRQFTRIVGCNYPN